MCQQDGYLVFIFRICSISLKCSCKILSLLFEIFVKCLLGGHMSILFLEHVEQILSLFYLFLCHGYVH